jgi:hypothetical protein
MEQLLSLRSAIDSATGTARHDSRACPTVAAEGVVPGHRHGISRNGAHTTGPASADDRGRYQL